MPYYTHLEEQMCWTEHYSELYIESHFKERKVQLQLQLTKTFIHLSIIMFYIYIGRSLEQPFLSLWHKNLWQWLSYDLELKKIK